MHKFRNLILGFAAVTALVVLTACGGGGDKKSGGILDNSNNSSSSGTPSSSGGSSSGSSSSSGAGGSLDLSKATKNLQDLKSFNFDVTLKMNLGDLTSSVGTPTSGSDFDLSGIFALLGNIKATGSYVAPDKMSVSASLMGQQFQYIQIGNQAYTKQGNANWTKSSSSSNPFSDLTSGSSASSIPQDALKNAKVTKETVNGIKATRYSYDRNALEQIAKSSGGSSATDTFKDFDKAQMDIWVSDDNGVPVKMAIDMSGKDDKKQNVGLQMEFNIKDLNSSSIQIKAPI